MLNTIGCLLVKLHILVKLLLYKLRYHLNVRADKFKCSIDQAKRAFFRAANSIFAKVGRLVSEEVIVQLLKQKCLPILLYGLAVCNLDKRSMHSLDFYTVNRFFYEAVSDI